MFMSEWAIFVVRLIVIAAAGLAAVTLVKRSQRRRLTGGVILGGIFLALVSTALQFVQIASGWRGGVLASLLSRLDAPGFALILFGVVLGLRDVCRAGDQLRSQNQALRKEASTDFLTGLLNRRQADFLLDYGAARARRSGDPLGFVMIDLDRFKQVNDTHGHQAGDAVLAHVATLLKDRIRTSDILARYGGEEFLVVLPDARLEDVVALAEKLRMLIESSPTRHGNLQIPITASMGVALSRVDTPDAVADAIGKADAALYSAKAIGRNRVVTWEQCASAETTMGYVDHASPLLASAK